MFRQLTIPFGWYSRFIADSPADSRGERVRIACLSWIVADDGQTVS